MSSSPLGVCLPLPWNISFVSCLAVPFSQCLPSFLSVSFHRGAAIMAAGLSCAFGGQSELARTAEFGKRQPQPLLTEAVLQPLLPAPGHLHTISICMYVYMYIYTHMHSVLVYQLLITTLLEKLFPQIIRI